MCFRIECLYRLLVSSLAVQWKSYLMATGSNLFPFILTGEQECIWMTLFYCFTHLGSRIHYTAGTFIRYMYVKSSLQPQLKEGFNRKRILFVCLSIPQFLLLIHTLDALRVYNTKEQFPLILYQACIDPTSGFSIPLYTLMPFQQTMTFVYVFAMIYFNLFLYKFLRYDFKKLKKYKA